MSYIFHQPRQKSQPISTILPEIKSSGKRSRDPFSETVKACPFPSEYFVVQEMMKTIGYRYGIGILLLVVLAALCVSPASAAIGSIVAWGDDWAGQVTDTPAGTTFTAISAFSDTSAALKSDGSLAGWGNNGDPPDGRASPPSGTDYVAVSQGNTHGLALRSNGSIAGWGNNDYGQQDFSGTDYAAVETGDAVSFALFTNGSIVHRGYIGGSNLNFVPSGNDFTNISFVYLHALALRSDGSIAAWGVDYYGEIDDTPPGTGFTAIEAGPQYSLALHSNGSIYGWGRNDVDQINVPHDTGYVAIAAGGNHGLALHSNGSVIAWGRNAEGQATVPASSDYRAVAAGGAHSLAIMGGTIIPDFEADVTSGTEPLTVTFTDLSPSSPTSWSWDFGDSDSTNSTHQHPVHTYTSAGTYTVALTATNANGPGTTTRTDYITVTPRPPVAAFTATPRYGTAPLDVQFTDISSYSPTSWSWEFGDGSTSALQSPSHTYSSSGLYTVNLTATNAQGSNTSSVKNYIRVFAHEPGAIAAWGGYNDFGQASPPTGTDYIAVDGGYCHSIALRADGSIVAWGCSDYGALDVPEGNEYTAIAAGKINSLALRENGSITGWGSIGHGGLHNIPAGTDYVAITMGDEWGAALHENGSIAYWGDYGSGSYGLDTPPSGEGYAALDGFYKQALALAADGSIADWGMVTQSGEYSPPAGTGHTAIAHGEWHGLAVRADGSVAMWGDDNSSQLHIPDGTYTAVAAGRDFSLALRSNGSIAQSGAVLGENYTAPAGDQYTAIAAGEFHGLAIGNIALTADFTGNRTVGVKPLVVQFTDTTTGGTPTSWLWDFGDGDTTDATLRNPLHTYSASGDYTVMLTVTNTMGSDSVIKPDYITVLDITAPPVADFTADMTIGTVPMMVDFTDTSLNYPTSWSWDFGDGGTSTEQNPTHTYTTAGSFDVTLTATNSIGSDSETKIGYITGITKPQADFTSNTTSGMRPLAVQFNDTSLYSPTIWTWDFGDGTSSGDKDPIHTYNTAGVYTVALRATNGAGSNWENKTDYITVAELEIQPVADFSANSTAGLIPFAVAFTDLSENTPTSWSWDFGDGGTSTEQDPVHVYTTPGLYSVTLETTNGGGSDSETKSSYMTVLAVPAADFTGTPRSGTAPLTVTFTDTSLYEPTYWTWDFGDSGTSTEQNPAHTYASAGTYTVSLTATNAQGSNTSTKSGYITVTSTGTADMIGVYRPSTRVFYLDYNGNGAWNGASVDRQYTFGMTGDLPIIGDWNGDGTMEIGVYRPSTRVFYLDYNGNGAWNGASVDRQYTFGMNGDLPIIGDWNGDGTTEIGVYHPSTRVFFLDFNGNGAWNGASVDRQYTFGVTGDTPITGDWNDNRDWRVSSFDACILP